MQVSVPHALAQCALCHTQPNNERKAELNLQEQAFATFLLQMEKTNRHARPLKTVQRPLFPRYLFVCLEIVRDRWLSVNSTIGVSRLFTQEGRPVAVSFGVVENLLAHSDAGLMRLDHSLAEGLRVRILSGTLADFTARVVRVDARRRVNVLLKIVGATVPVSVDRCALASAA